MPGADLAHSATTDSSLGRTVHHDTGRLFVVSARAWPFVRISVVAIPVARVQVWLEERRDDAAACAPAGDHGTPATRTGCAQRLRRSATIAGAAWPSGTGRGVGSRRPQAAHAECGRRSGVGDDLS